jgi:predicted HAD superfamily Cof-like phosphohydrolase
LTQTNYQKVAEFHKTFDAPILDSPQFPSDERIILRKRLIFEELLELDESLLEWDIVAAADALGDIAYVVYGMALEFGIDLDAVVAEIHRSNMTKLGLDGKPIHREDGKMLKGPNYQPPNIKKILFPQNREE